MATRPMPSPLRYDLMLLLASRGREQRFRKRQIELARLVPGEAVLDIGCGTGTLAIAAAKAVRPNGTVAGVDPSSDLLGRARKKARRAGVEVAFETAGGDDLPFDDTSFDAVLSTLVFHHLPGEIVHRTFGEIRRVLKPHGRVFVVDIGGPQDDRKTFHGRHVSFDLDTFMPKLAGAGLRAIDSGPIDSGMRSLENLRYFLAELE